MTERSPAPPLLPCPLCGCSEFAALADFEGNCSNCKWGKWGRVVVCNASGVDGHRRGCGASTGYCETDAEAVERWNRRAPVSEIGPSQWISVKDRLPEAPHGSPYMHFHSDPVLVLHSDRPDYPLTAHAVFADSPDALGVYVLTNGASKYKTVSWYSVGRDLANPFDLKDQDYGRFMPRRFGSCITHWMPIPSATTPNSNDTTKEK